MTAKEKLLERVPRWSEEQAEVALRAVEGEPEMVGAPEAWKTFEDGTPTPNWVALRDEARRGHLARRSSASSLARVRSTLRSLRP
jgi:hypothetical protein